MRHLSLVLFTILALVACGTPAAPEEVKPVDAVAGDVKPAEPAPEVKPADPAPAAGVTKDALTASASADFPALAPWGETLGKVELKLGKAMKVNGDIHMWYVKDGEQCTILTATKMGDIVGGAVVTTGPCPTP